MAITARDVIQDALEDLGVVESGETLSAGDLQMGWKKLQSMCGSWRRQGVDIPELISPFDNIVDEITADDDDDGIDDNLSDNQDISEALAANLAVRLAPKFGVTPSPVTIEMARRGEEDIFRNTLKIHIENNPVTLEIAQIMNGGSGSYDINEG